MKYYNGIAWTFTWKNGRQLATAVATGKNISYTYDVDGIRDSKTVGGVTHYYETMNGQVVRETWTQSGTTHTLDIVTDNNGNPYALVYDGTTYYYVLNAQGDVVRLVDSDGATVANYTYNAWGEILSVTNASGASITSSTHIANINPIRYRGYYYDTETGFYYLQSRYYDPAIGRFLNADKYASTGGSYLGYNMYAYCNNNPIMCVDPTGSCNCAYGPTKSDFIRANQGLPPMNCPHSVATEAVEKSGGEPTNPNIYTHCSTEHGDETLTITSLEYITLAESKLIQDELEDNNTWGFVLEKMKGALTGAVTWGVGYTLEKTTETAFTKILSKAMKIGGGSVTVVCGAWSAIDSALYTFELKRWEDANDVATEGVLKVSGTYSFESSDGGYSKSYTYYYPWDGQSEIPIPVFE